MVEMQDREAAIAVGRTAVRTLITTMLPKMKESTGEVQVGFILGIVSAAAHELEMLRGSSYSANALASMAKDARSRTKKRGPPAGRKRVAKMN